MNNASSSSLFIKLTLFFSFFSFFVLNLVAIHGIAAGLHLGLLGWSCYVMCLPFFGGSVLLYPLALMVGKLSNYVLEMIAWMLSIGLHVATIHLLPGIYQRTPATHFVYWCLTHPFPYWILFALCFAPVMVIMLKKRYNIPARDAVYYQIRFFCIAASLAFLGYVAIHDLIILSNIHA